MINFLRTAQPLLNKVSTGLLAAASLAAFLNPQSASAVEVFVPGYGLYDIQVQNEFFTDLNPPASSMPWWGNQAAANDFATAAGPELGAQYENLGPFFAWAFVNDTTVYTDAFCNEQPCFDSVGEANTAFSFGPESPSLIGNPDPFTPYPWATATAVPGPLPILGAAAALSYSRKLRNRIKNSKMLPIVSSPN